jgi:anhydro-N-acetylmuramic acid kinase
MKADGVSRLLKLQRKKTKNIIGLMSGTSTDGISAVAMKVEGSGAKTKFQILSHEIYAYPVDVQRKIFDLFSVERGTVDKICHMNFLLGEFFAEAALKVAKEADLSKAEIDLIGSHGQTVYHRPKLTRDGKYYIRSTLQIGEPSVIAERTGSIVVGDFRVRDVAAGGQGAPISAYVDFIIFRDVKKSRLIQNIGGIANVTAIPAGSEMGDVKAFDTGPGNMLIDASVRHITHQRLEYDKYGEIAAKGKVNRKLLLQLMEHPYLAKLPPKTTGREEFGEQYAANVIEKALILGLSSKDLVATLTAFTVESIAQSYEKFVNPHFCADEVIVGGGGAYNKTMLRMLKKRLAPTTVFLHEDFGIPSSAKEALMIGLLANETIMGSPSNMIGATGAKKKVVLGKIIL